jgi:hypothetical protein
VRVVLITAFVAGHDHRCMQHTKLAASRTSSWPTRIRLQERVSLIIIGGMATIGDAITGPPRLKRKFVLSVVESSVFGMATGCRRTVRLGEDH